MAGKKQGSFRDRISTVSDSGGREWIYNNKPKGRLYNQRTAVSIVLLTLFFSFPFLKLKGEPLILLNIFQRKFIIFGQVYWPQDFHLFVIAMLIGLLTIVLFTVIYGRIWCGWMCPQTIFMEMVFRKIEFWIEGNAATQKKLNNAGISFEWVWKKILKHALFLVIAALVSHTIVCYFIGIERMKVLFSSGPEVNIRGFVVMLVFTGVTYFIFARFREQICVLVCPYGRLQSVLLDSNSLVVSYDYKRGEPKQLFKKGEDRKKAGKGDCIDCYSCVSVCPTGIDIRNGTQLECINCTACIDACNSVMRRIGFPDGLVRIASENSIRYGTPFRFTPRIIAYTSVVILLTGILVVMFSLRSQVESTILRVPGSLYNEIGESKISNIYNLKTVNKTNRDLAIEVKLLSHEGKVEIIGDPFTIGKNERSQVVFLLIMNKNDIVSTRTEVRFGIFGNGELMETVKSTFIGP